MAAGSNARYFSEGCSHGATELGLCSHGHASQVRDYSQDMDLKKKFHNYSKSFLLMYVYIGGTKFSRLSYFSVLSDFYERNLVLEPWTMQDSGLSIAGPCGTAVLNI